MSDQSFHLRTFLAAVQVGALRFAQERGNGFDWTLHVVAGAEDWYMEQSTIGKSSGDMAYDYLCYQGGLTDD